MNLSAKTRTYIYSILLAVQPLAIAYGFISHDMSVLWINVIASVLGGGLSLTNITPDPTQKQTATVTTTTTHVDLPTPSSSGPVAPVAPVAPVTAPDASVPPLAASADTAMPVVSGL